MEDKPNKNCDKIVGQEQKNKKKPKLHKTQCLKERDTRMCKGKGRKLTH